MPVPGDGGAVSTGPRQARLVATIVGLNSDGEPRSITGWSPRHASLARFYGLEVTAYVEGSPGVTASGIWAPRVRYTPYDIQTAAQARAIAAVLGRIERDLDQLNTAEGYLTDSDYAGYMIRVGQTLSTSRFLVRTFRRSRQDNGPRQHLVDGSGLRSWVEQVDTDVRRGDRCEHLPGAPNRPGGSR